MPVRLTAIEQEEALKQGSSELKFLLAREQVDEALQAKFFSVGIISVPKFATIVSDEAEMKTLLKDEFELDATTDLASRVKVSSVIVAYKSAQGRTAQVAVVEGELEAKHLTRPLGVTEYTSMRSSWEQKWWPLDDSSMPSRAYLESRCNDLESGDMRAETLTSILNRDEDSVEGFQSFWDLSGNLQLKRSNCTVAEPANPEALRKRIKLMGTGIMMIALRNTNRPAIQNCTPQDWEDYLQYLLGDYVWNLVGKNADGSTVACPSWNQLLVYELAIRKKMYNDMTSHGLPLRTSLRNAYNCPVTKERFFTTPVALSSINKRPLAFNDQDNSKKQAKGGKGGEEREGKGGGEGERAGGRERRREREHCHGNISRKIQVQLLIYCIEFALPGHVRYITSNSHCLD